MTEVDYSPEAYQRYMAQRARVGHWAVEASACAADYTHPFDGHQPRRRAADYGPVPVVRPDDSISLYEPPSRRRDSSRDRSRERRHRTGHGPPERPVRPRAMTAPSAQARPVQVPPPVPAPPHYASAPHPAPAPSKGYTTVDLRQYQPSSSGEYRLAPPRPGESYMIIPPKGKRVQVIQSSGHYTVKTTSASASAPTSPTQQYYTSSAQAYLTTGIAAPQRKPSNARSVSPAGRVPVSPVSPGYIYPSHTPAHPSPLHVSVPQAQYLPTPAGYTQDPSPNKKKQAPLLKRLLTSHVTWDQRKPQPGRRLSD